METSSTPARPPQTHDPIPKPQPSVPLSYEASRTVEDLIGDLRETIGLFMLFFRALAYCDDVAHDGHQRAYSRLEDLGEQAWKQIDQIEETLPRGPEFFGHPRRQSA